MFEIGSPKFLHNITTYLSSTVLLIFSSHDSHSKTSAIHQVSFICRLFKIESFITSKLNHSSLIGLGVGAFIEGHATLKATSSKVIKYEKVRSDNQHVFISFVFDIFGFLTSEAVDLLHSVQRVIHSNVMSPRSMNVVFTSIDFVI